MTSKTDKDVAFVAGVMSPVIQDINKRLMFLEAKGSKKMNSVITGFAISVVVALAAYGLLALIGVAFLGLHFC